MANVLPPAAIEPALYGLVNPKTLASTTARWVSGFEQESVACMADVNLLDVCNQGIDTQVIERTGTGTTGPYLPFAVQAAVKCSTAGGLRTDWEQRALDALEQCQNKAIELEFWEGRLARAANDDEPDSNPNPNRYLTDGGAEDLTPTTGTAIRVRHGLALLEGALADAGCGGRGYIHVPRSIGSVLPVKDRDGDGVLQTTLGNYVIAGEGYTGTGEDGAAPAGTAQWIFATGPVTVRLDEPNVAADYPKQSINTETNDIEVSAERMAAVTWDGCVHIGVLVDLSLDYA